jgi:arylsulfatase A-like enzyme
MRSNKDNVDKPLEGKGDLSEAKEIKQIATDLEKLKSDFDDETIQLMKEQFDKDKKPGEGFLDYIKRQPDDFFKNLRVELSRESMLDMLKNEYPVTYLKYIDNLDRLDTESLRQILNNLDKDRVPFSKGGTSNYKKHLRKP